MSNTTRVMDQQSIQTYRKNVAAFIVDDDNNFLFCHRRDHPRTEGFQVPQGGVENGETFEEAISRELKEEVGLNSFTILGKIKNPIRYKWHLGEPNRGSSHVGQEQTYFLVKVTSSEKENIVATDDFDFYSWVNIEVILSEIIDFKKPVYKKAYFELRYLNSNYSFKAMQRDDLKLIEKWLSMPHVKEFWDDGKSWEESYEKYILRTASEVVKPFIISHNGLPIGYIQFYWAGKVGDGWWENYPNDVIGIDQYIGDPEYMGKGHGTIIIKDFISYISNNFDFSKIITDPTPSNTRAIRCYEKVGFRGVREINTPDGAAFLMEFQI